jgi:hypothetical protein
MGFGRYRFRRSFGNVASQFRGARPSTYPLFSGLLDQYPNAAAAYSLRALSSGWLASGPVVEVRRSSDSTTQDFTAGQITGGQMLSFVNNDTTSLYNSARYFDGTGYVTVPDFAALDLGSIFKLRTTFLPTSIAAIGQGILGRWDGASNKRSYLLIFQAVVGVKFLISTDGTSTAITLEDGDVGVNELKEIEVIADGVNVSLYVNGQLKDSAAFSGTPFASDKTLEVGTYNNGQASLTFLGGIISAAELENAGSTVWAVTGLGTSVTAWEDTIGSNDGTETNGAAYTGQPFNGFVSTWYDQSGNANDATQATTTAQPKIVSAGASGDGGLKFDGVDDLSPMLRTFQMPPHLQTDKQGQQKQIILALITPTLFVDDSALVVTTPLLGLTFIPSQSRRLFFTPPTNPQTV